MAPIVRRAVGQVTQEVSHPSHLIARLKERTSRADSTLPFPLRPHRFDQFADGGFYVKDKRAYSPSLASRPFPEGRLLITCYDHMHRLPSTSFLPPLLPVESHARKILNDEFAKEEEAKKQPKSSEIKLNEEDVAFLVRFQALASSLSARPYAHDVYEVRHVCGCVYLCNVDARIRPCSSESRGGAEARCKGGGGG
jgi:hypothetical protein